MSGRFYLALFLASFAAGVFLRSFFEISLGFSLFAVITGVFFLLFWHFKSAPLFVLLGILFISFGLGAVRYGLKDRKGISPELKNAVGQNSVLTGAVVREPDERENSTRLVVKSEKSGDKILVVAGRYPEFSYGDILRLEGTLEEPVRRLADSNFDYRAYLAKDEIFLEMFYPEIKKTGAGAGWKLKEVLISIKQKYVQNLSRALPEPEASFLAGLTVGARKSIPQKVLDDFTKVGAIHVVALSGYNVTIVARAVSGFFGAVLPHFLGVGAGLLGIFLFAVLTGASATVVRASIMAAILYVAGLSGRVYQAKTALFAAGFLMILLNPKILRFDLSFQLSFLATLGLLYISPHIEKFVGFLPRKFLIKESAVATLSAQIAVLPILLYSTGAFSVVSLPANILILLAVPPAMFFGFLAGAAGFFNYWLAVPFGWLAYILAAYQLKIAELFANLPFAEINF